MIATQRRGNGNWLHIVEQHPSGEISSLRVFFTAIRQIMRIIAESCIAPHHIIGIKSCRPYTNSALKIIFDSNRNRRNVPPVLKRVLESGTMSGARRKSPWFERKWVRLGSEWTQRSIAYNNSIGVPAEFGARRAILQIIFTMMFGHPGTFNKWVQKSIVVVFPKTLPSITPILQEIHFFSCSQWLHRLPVQ